MELLTVFEAFFKTIPQLEEKIKPYAKNASLEPKEAILLLAYYYGDSFDIDVNEELKQRLIQKGLIEYNDKSLSFSKKGEIIVKSVINGLKR